MDRINKEILLNKKYEILRYLSDCYDDYSMNYFMALKEAIESGDLELVLSTSEAFQIYSKFGIFNEGKDIYAYFANLLKKYGFLNTNCCEVGAGSFLRLAELVYPTLKQNGKSLTVYDPWILIKELYDVSIKEEYFDKKTDISEFDTLYGTFPCDATIDMVEKALEEDKNLLIALCGCDHSNEKYPLWVNDYWADDFCMNIKEEYGNQISILRWSDNIEGFVFPIMVRMTEEHKRKYLKI